MHGSARSGVGDGRGWGAGLQAKAVFWDVRFIEPKLRGY